MANLPDDQKIEKVLSYDPLQEAERATGKHWQESEMTGFLGMALALEHNRHKAEVLAKADDTHMSQTLPQWLGVIERLGFEKVLDEPVEGTGDRFRIFWRPGCLLRTDSYFDDTAVNSAEVYLNFRGPRVALPPCSNGFVSDVDGQPVWDVGKDAREGLRFFLQRLESGGEILPNWVKKGFLWLLDYAQPKQTGYDHDALNAERIARLPEHVRSAIRGR